MALPFFKKSTQKFLGIDIGTSAIKIIELSKSRDKIKLENYGEMIIQSQGDSDASKKHALTLSDYEIARAISEILNKAQISSRDAFFALPDFSTFFTILELPQMQKSDLPQAVQYEARQHIPLPLSEVTLDWSVINHNSLNRSKIKVLLVAVPHDVVNQYQTIARECQVKPVSLEAEVFGLVRALVKNKEGVVGLIDAGAQTTTFNIVENGVLKMTHSFDFSGNELTRTISKSLNISYNEAEELKKKYGVLTPEMPVGRILNPFVTLLSGEIDKITKSFHKTDGKEMKKIILAGGLSLLPGLKDILSNLFKKPVEIGDSFSGMVFPEVIEGVLKEMSPSYAVVTGTAMRGFE